MKLCCVRFLVFFFAFCELYMGLHTWVHNDDCVTPPTRPSYLTWLGGQIFDIHKFHFSSFWRCEITVKTNLLLVFTFCCPSLINNSRHSILETFIDKLTWKTNIVDRSLKFCNRTRRGFIKTVSWLYALTLIRCFDSSWVKDFSLIISRFLISRLLFRALYLHWIIILSLFV